MSKILPDLTGKRFNRLTVERLDRVDPIKGRLWFCRCTCSGTVVLQGCKLTGKKPTHSCGCLKDEQRRKGKHGLCRPGKVHPLYKIWNSMRMRCLNPRDKGWKNYGGRGITVCQAWDSFPQFLRDMGPRPPGTTLERRNNNGNYTPKNCRWATQREQNRNRRKLVWLTFRGRRRLLTDWAHELGLTLQSLWQRLYVYRWPKARALTSRNTRHYHHPE